MVEGMEDGQNEALYIRAGEDIGAEVIIFMQQEVEQQCGLVVLQVGVESLVQRSKLQLEGCHCLCWGTLSRVCKE